MKVHTGNNVNIIALCNSSSEVVKVVFNSDNNVSKGVAALRHFALEDVLGFYNEKSE